MRMKAFPTLADNGHITTQDGMDLRDYFAAKALVGLLSGMEKGQEMQVVLVASAAYKIADLMMEARKDD